MIEHKIIVEEIVVDGKLIDGPTGTIVMVVNNYIERLQKMKEAGMTGDPAKAMESLAGAIEMAEKQCVKIDVKIGDKTFDSLEALSYFKEGTDIINYVIGIVSNGIPLKKI
jgi:hypothetical protein